MKTSIKALFLALAAAASLAVLGAGTASAAPVHTDGGIGCTGTLGRTCD